ncbi:Regulator of chromosome condensation (RCC1) family with FYVE zinc finger domain-containing protein [Rhynchospora pubera]|uniref:Regulator of chromosome condensation (RCC1) family with FYVE zinc finger domain-containing protein n=1 Tax=Rhynchospora pubera TaxID=906938 RepID=A0AAV8HBC4_9POAL|nr:Regulator of chromosome condensation (RCC1) family with FYVE zinc finger domain-containing protein [Rhynchospora pubera]
MANSIRNSPIERDIDQAITLLKKGAHLLKYGRRGKPKFCPFRLSKDENVLIWYSGSHEKMLYLNQVSKIIPGQRTAIFRRYPRPDKEYQSFSLIYGDRSLDLICKDKDEAETWFVGLKALIGRKNYQKLQTDFKSDRSSCDSQSTRTTKDSVLTQPFSDSDHPQKVSKDGPHNYQNQRTYHDLQTLMGLNLFSDVLQYTAPSKHSESNVLNTSVSFTSGKGEPIGHGSSYENLRVSLSSQVSSSSYGSGPEDFDAMGDVLIWGNGPGQHCSNTDSSLPRQLESTSIFDIHSVACGARHAALVTKQGEVYSWGEEYGGRLGHGIDADSSHPKLIMAISGLNIEHVACGEFHTCAVTMSGDLYTWGDGFHSPGLLGHGNDTSHWIPKQLCGPVDGLHVSSVSCGPWHTAFVTSSGYLYTFGDGAFGALGHGDRESVREPRLVETLKEMRTVQVSCGVWHTAAIVEVPDMCFDPNSPSGKLFTWGNGDKGRLGHGDTEPKLVPACVMSLGEPSFCRVACGHDMTVALCTSGQVYTMGSNTHGQLGDPNSDGKLPTCVVGNIKDCFVEEISCGAYHVAVLTAKTEVYTWGKGTNGQLGHGDKNDRKAPTLVEALRDKQVKMVVCGSDYTVAICLHKRISSSDQSICSGCRLLFSFRRKRHNCYNCGLVFCKNCSSRKAIRASLAPNLYKPYRVCDDCYNKLKKTPGGGSRPQTPRDQCGTLLMEETLDGNGNAKVYGNLSRLSSAESKIESRPSISKNTIPLPPSLSLMGNANQSASDFSNSNGAYKYSKRIFSLSLPASRAASRSASPLSRRPSTPFSAMAATTTCLSPGICFLGPQQAEDGLVQEVSKLRSQVEELTRQSDILEDQLEKTSNMLREALARAEEESAKNKAATEVILSLSNQLKEIREAENVPDQSSIPLCDGGTPHASTSEDRHHLISGTGTSSDHQQLSSNCNNIITQEEVVEQVEPGVYITITFSRIGDKNLKRIRFSRKKFTEKQAEGWWTENRSRLKEKYGIVSEVAVRVQDPVVPKKIP